MIPKKIKIMFFGFIACFPQIAMCQADDFIRSAGKIYVVVGVLLLIFFGIVGFLFNLEKRINKIEKNLNIDNE